MSFAQHHGGLNENGEVAFDFAGTASGEKTDEIRFPNVRPAVCQDVVDERVSDKLRRETCVFEQLLFKGKDAHHQVKHLDHFRDAALVPGPDLRRDEVNDFGIGAVFADAFRKAQVEPRIVDEDQAFGLFPFDAFQHAEKVFFEPSVAFQNFDKPDDGSFIRPVFDLGAEFVHAFSAETGKFDIGIQPG